MAERGDGDMDGRATRSAATPATAIIARFGGIRPMAAKLEVAVTTVQGWKERGHIPAARHQEVLEAARKHDIPLTLAELRGEETGAAAGAGEAMPARSEAAAEPAGARAGTADVPESRAEGPERPEAGAAPEPKRRDETGRRPGPPSARPGPAKTAGRVRYGALAAAAAVLAVAGGWVWWEWGGGREALPWLGTARTPSPSLPAAGTQPTQTETAGGAGSQTAPPSASAPTPAAGETPQPSGTNEDGPARTGAAPAETTPPAGATAEKPPGSPEEAEAGKPAPAEPATGGTKPVPGGTKTAQPSAGPEAAGASGPGAEELAALKARTDRLADELQAGRNRISELEQQVEEARRAAEASAATPAPPGPGRAAALVLAVGQLRDALRGSGPYADALEAVQSLGSDNPRIADAIAPLAATADKGIPTREALRKRFDAVAAAAVNAAGMPAQPTWYERALHQLASLVTVRRIGEVEGDSVEARVARAGTRLDDGNLAGAVDALDGLSGRARAAAAPWIAAASERLAAERALEKLQAVAIEAIGGGTGAGRGGTKDTSPAGAGTGGG